MKVLVFSSVSPFMLDRLLPFSKDFNGKSWREMYDAICFLRKEYPDCKFDSEPLNYIDFTNKTTGFLFFEEITGDLYYVFK